MVEFLEGRYARQFAARQLGRAFQQLNLMIMSVKAQERPGAEEAVAADALASDHALEQERPITFLNLAEGADRRERVADQLAIDRHDPGVAGQLGEFFKGRQIAHAASAAMLTLRRLPVWSYTVWRRLKRGSQERRCLRMVNG